MSNNNGLHTTDVEREEPISYEESIGIAGVAPDEADEGLLPPDKLLETNGRSIESSPISRSVLVFGTLGAFFLGWVVISNLGGKNTQFAETEDTQEEIAVEPNESDAFRSQLALVDQQYDGNQAQPTEETPVSAETPAEIEAVATPVSTASPPPASAPPSPRPAPAAPTPSSSTPSRSEPPATIAQPPEPEVDPFEQWTKLAMAGVSGSDLAVVEQTRPVASRNSDSGTYTADSSAGFAIATIGDEPLVTEPQATFAQWRTIEAPRPSASIRPLETEPADSEPAEPKPDLLQQLRENEQQRTESSEPEQLEADLQAEDSAVTLARLEQSVADREASDSGDVNPEIAQDRQLSAGAQGILNRASSNAQSQSQVHQIATGTSAAATVVVPIVYSPDSGNGDTRSSERFAVTLKEPLVDVNGLSALPEGTVLITEIESISVQSRVVNQAVVAIVYEDRNGNMRQEMIGRGVLSIRGRNNTALIAQLSNGQDTISQDLRIGLSSALGNIGRTINSGNTTSTSSSTNNSASSTTVFSNGDRNILAAAMEGFFGATTERMQQRLEPDDERLPVLVVPEGEEVSVFVNGLLNVNR